MGIPLRIHLSPCASFDILIDIRKTACRMENLLPATQFSFQSRIHSVNGKSVIGEVSNNCCHMRRPRNT